MKPDILKSIVEHKQTEVAALPAGEISLPALQQAVAAHGPRRPFMQTLRNPRRPGPALIAEVKKASPSAGVICPDFDPVRIARAYESAGASCLSVLTDARFFQGSLEDLRRVREAVALPLLRKDFIIDARQILEAIAWGADAVLLIAAILDDGRLEHFMSLAKSAGLAALVEVHDQEEMDRAVRIGADLLGVNNRNLKNFQVDLATTERLAARLREQGVLDRTLLVAESGIHTRADVRRLSACGAGAILVGESLMRQGDIAGKVDELLG